MARIRAKVDIKTTVIRVNYEISNMQSHIFNNAKVSPFMKEKKNYHFIQIL